jgi:hypothetical protein
MALTATPAAAPSNPTPAGRSSASVALALRQLSALVALPLPGMTAAAPAAGKALTALLKKAPDASHPVAQDCFRLLAGEGRAGPLRCRLLLALRLPLYSLCLSCGLPSLCSSLAASHMRR